MIYLFRERGKKGEREGEKHQCVVAPHLSPPGPATQSCALNGNGTSDPLVRVPALNPLSYTSQGSNIFIKHLLKASLYSR